MTDPMEEYDIPDNDPEQEIIDGKVESSFKVVDKRKYFELIKYRPHGRQWLFHESKARFKVVVAGRRAGKTFMTAKDIQPLLLVPNKRIWIVGPQYDLAEREFRVVWDDMIVRLGFGREPKVKKSYCVDTKTEILTKRGWLRYNELKVGDETLAINEKTGLSEWNVIEAVNTFVGNHKMIKMEGSTFSAFTTEDHRWLTNRRKKQKYLVQGWHWRTSANLTDLDKIPKAVPCVEIPTEPKYTDEFVELVAWIWTEGGLNSQGKSFVIHQSHDVNPNNVSRIRRALQVLCPNPIKGNRGNPSEYWSERTQDKITKFDLGVEISKEFWKVFIVHKLVRPSFILSLTRSQLELFVRVSVLGDGHISKKDGSTNIAQKGAENLFAVELACALLGTPTSLYKRYDGQFNLFITKRLWNRPVHSSQIAKARYSGGMRINKVNYNGTVWCPTTKSGTWLARRNGKVYYTGNSKKMGNMYIEFPWNTRLEARSAERPDTLVGESLDYVVMSEAAKHNRETWTRYIYPALSDKRGGAILSSTPEGMNYMHELWQLGQNREIKEYEGFKFPSWENQLVFPGGREDDEIKLMERTMPKEEFEQEIAASFTSFSGRIYSEFEEQIHVRKVEYDPSLPNYMAFDWGFVNPLAAVEFQIDSMQRVRVWREHYKARVILEDHLEILKHRTNPPGYKIDLCFGDAADQGAIETVCARFAPCYGDPKSKDNWMEGVQLVKSFLKLQEVGKLDEYGTPKEEPWLIVDHSCVNGIREFNNYRSAPRRGGRVELSPREAAQKYDDHFLDALRYGIMHIFKLGANVRLSSAVTKSELSVGGSDRGFFTSESGLLYPGTDSGFITRGIDF